MTQPRNVPAGSVVEGAILNESTLFAEHDVHPTTFSDGVTALGTRPAQRLRLFRLYMVKYDAPVMSEVRFDASCASHVW